MTGPADIDTLAAEYVVGTLDQSERSAVSARLATDPALRSAVAQWELRLAPLADLVEPIAPPARLAAEIERRLTDASSSVRPAAVVGSTRTATAGAAVIDLDLQRRLRRWRSVAIATSAIAASLAVYVGIRESAPRPDTNFVAVFQKDDASPSFVMSVDLTSRTLSVKRVAADVPAGKTYQLWIASDKLGVGPQSLGLVEQGSDVKRALTNIDPNIVQSALFGVSLEPAGGSPTGKPTGPVFHARLIPTTP